jgi:hypothetical protein
MIADHLRASELSVIDTRTLEGLASLTVRSSIASRADYWGSIER